MQNRNYDSQDDSQDVLTLIRTQARFLAATLSRKGYERKAIENELFSSGFHPSVCWETINWLESQGITEDPPREALNSSSRGAWN